MIETNIQGYPSCCGGSNHQEAAALLGRAAPNPAGRDESVLVDAPDAPSMRAGEQPSLMRPARCCATDQRDELATLHLFPRRLRNGHRTRGPIPRNHWNGKRSSREGSVTCGPRPEG
jgi:hypothetical protein